MMMSGRMSVPVVMVKAHEIRLIVQSTIPNGN